MGSTRIARSRFAWLPAFTVVALTRVALAQDAPAAPSAPAPAPDVPSAPPPDAPPPFAEPAPAPAAPAPPDAPVPNEPPPAPSPAPPSGATPPAPATDAPKTGSASFEPVPEPAKPRAKPTAPPKPAAPRADTPVTDAADTEPATPSPAPPPPAPGSDARADGDDTNGIFGPFRLGFLVGGGLPDLVSLGGVLKLTRYFGAGVNVGLIPTVRISYYGQATLSFQEYDAYAHIFPFGGSLFIGAGVGYATVKGSLATHFDLSSYKNMYPQAADIPNAIDVSSQASVRTMVLTPQLGLLHTFGSGFTIGADVGAQLPIAPSQVDFSTQIPSNIPTAYKAQIQKQYIDPNDAKVRSSLDKIGRTPIPTFNIKIGWLL